MQTDLSTREGQKPGLAPATQEGVVPGDAAAEARVVSGESGRVNEIE